MAFNLFKTQPDSGENSFEDHIMYRASLVGCIISLTGTISNILLSLSFILTAVSFLGFLFYLWLYILIRTGKQRGNHYLLISVFTILFLNVLWYINNQGTGPILYLLVVCYLFVLIIPRNPKFYLILGLAFLNLIILLLLDLFGPQGPGSYPNYTSRIIDIYVVAFFSVLLLLVIVSISKNFYLKELEHARESDKLKTAFLNNLSHEIRTPLNAIMGFSSIIAEDGIDKTNQKEYGTIIQESGTQLCTLINNLIYISKIESDNLKFKPAKVDLEPFFKKLLDDFAPRFTEKQLDINCLLRGNQKIITDTDLLRTIFTELITNALKYSKKGKTRFGMINCKGKCIFYVRDSGIGIRTENLSDIFDSFIKITEYSATLTRGTGIGLCMVKKMVQKLGSEIKVKSVFKKGSVFYFEIPGTP